MSFCIPDRWAAPASENPELTTGRITLQERGIYRICTAAGQQNALVSGRFQFDTQSVSDYPAVGDYVMADSAPTRIPPSFIRYCPAKVCLYARQEAPPKRNRWSLPTSIPYFCA